MLIFFFIFISISKYFTKRNSKYVYFDIENMQNSLIFNMYIEMSSLFIKANNYCVAGMCIHFFNNVYNSIPYVSI